MMDKTTSQTFGPSIGNSGYLIRSRYRDAYLVGTMLIGLGNTIKIVGGVIAGIIAVMSLSAGALGILGLIMAAISGGLAWVCGVIVTAQGQILRATLDTAVASSPFLTDDQRLQAMGLAGGDAEPVTSSKEPCPFCKELSLSANSVCEVCGKMKR